jgi:hypothetical protein
LIDGRLIAMWGVTGQLMATDGEGWLALTQAGRLHRFGVTRLAFRELRGLMETKRQIVSSILCHDRRARRFAEFLGFQTDAEKTINGVTLFNAKLVRPWH